MSLPALPDTFAWTRERWGPALRCEPLHAIAPHVFTTRQLALSSQEDWDRVAKAVGAGAIQMLTQVHGRNVFVVRSPEGLRHTAGDARSPEGLRHTAGDVRSPEGPRHNADPVAQGFSPESPNPVGDVLVSDDPRVAIAVRAADCVPVLIADPTTGTVAAVHAGWRGTAAGAATAAVRALEREFGARPADLVAAIGPSIGPCCYEVGTELVDAFAAAGHPRHLVDRWFPSPPPGRGAFERGKLRLDTWSANRDQLILAGLDEQNIHTCGLCTASHVDLFPSFRVEKEHAGRLLAVIRAARADRSDVPES